MLILHLSDLHVTEPGQNLATSWLRVQRALESADARTFDFIVVSGDLTQRAAPHEYQELHKFFEQALLPLVPGKDRARIVAVPGNHDVDWSAPIAEPLRLASAEPIELARLEHELSLYRAQPERSPLRIEIGRYAHFELMRLDEERYPQRLANAQRFLSDFYGGSLAARAGRGFQLTSREVREHFSAHVFGDEGVAFFGFSSLHGNDRYWTGSSISPHAVAAAHDFAAALDPKVLRVAVWHHGFSAERGRPDSLTAQDLGHLRAAGFRVGFHGHTHRARVDLSDLFDDRFAVVATGSYGAASTDRPDAVGNQFTIVRLNPTSLLADIYEKAGEAGVYARARRRYFDLTDRPREAAPFQNHAVAHRRAWKVRKDGIAHVQVTLDGLHAQPGMQLGVLTPPFCSARAKDHADTPAGSIPVSAEQVEDGRRRFRLRHSEEQAFGWLDWEYRVSNALALDRAELRLLQPRQRHYPNLGDDRELVSHTVRFHSDSLELLLGYDADSGGTIEGAWPLVERQIEREGEPVWERIAVEEKRCVVALESPQRATLRVAGPILGCRYGIAYRLALQQPLYPDSLALNADEVLRACMGRRPMVARGVNGQPLSERLFDWVTRMVALALSDQPLVPNSPVDPAELLSPTTTVMGMLWDAERRLLRPAFGNFWPHSWSARFACGEGIAGHAFRFGLPAGYYATGALAATPQSLIFKAHFDAYERPRRYRWLLSLPFTMGGKSALGAVTIASEEEPGTPAEASLSRLAHVLSSGESEPAMTTLAKNLQTAVEIGVLTVLRDAPELTDSLRRSARALLPETLG